MGNYSYFLESEYYEEYEDAEESQFGPYLHEGYVHLV